jgi:hypothetical protein
MSKINEYRKYLVFDFKGDEAEKLEFFRENSVIDWLDDDDYRKEYERLMVRLDDPSTEKVEGLRGSIIGQMWVLVSVYLMGDYAQKAQYKDESFDRPLTLSEYTNRYNADSEFVAKEDARRKKLEEKYGWKPIGLDIATGEQVMFL